MVSVGCLECIVVTMVLWCLLPEMCTKEVNALARAGVILLNEVDIKPTLPGRLMARYCVSFSTMKTFLQVCVPGGVGWGEGVIS